MHCNFVQRTLIQKNTTITADDGLMHRCHIDMIWPDLTKLHPEYYKTGSRLCQEHVRSTDARSVAYIQRGTCMESSVALSIPQRTGCLPIIISLLWRSCIACALSGHLIENRNFRVTQHSLRVHATWHDVEQGVALSDHWKSSGIIHSPYYNSVNMGDTSLRHCAYSSEQPVIVQDPT